MRSANILLNAYLLICICLFTTSCVGWLIGKTPEQITKEIDVNQDGEITPDEVKASPHDLNKDGELSDKEMEVAMAPHAAGDGLLAILSAFNIPLAIGLKKAISVARVHKENTYQLIDDIQGIKDLTLSGDLFTKEKITKLIVDGKAGYRNAEHLTTMVVNYKEK